jgi:uncharacterized membrane protein YbhN (UPF0104 family)
VSTSGGSGKSRWLVLSLVVLVLTVAGVSLVADLGRLGALGELARSFDHRFLLPIFLLAPANYLFRYYKWTILLRRAGLSVPPRLSLTIFLAGLSMTVTPAKAGELVKAHYLKETLGVPFEVSTPVIVAERVLDSASVLVLAVGGAVAGLASGAGAGLSAGPTAGAAILRLALWSLLVSAAGLAAVVLFLRSPKGPGALARALTGLPALGRWLGPRLGPFLEAFGAGSRRLLDWRTFAWCTLIGVVSWSLEGVVVTLTLCGLGYPSSVFLGVLVVALASLAGAVSMLPGGAGAAEATILGLLLLYGYPRAVAGTTTLVTRLATLWLGVAIGAVALAAVEARRRTDRERV